MHTNKHNTAYEVVLADTEESRKIHFSLRYQVYCIEKGYEDANQFLDNMEKDEHDAHAVHFLIQHKASKQWIGTFRLVIESLHKLPLCQHAKISILKPENHKHKFSEFSRLSLIRQFQRLPGKSAKTNGSHEIVFKAICTGIEYSRKNDVSVIIFLCRRSLAKIIEKTGLKVIKIGSKILHRGTRYPYKFDLTNFPNSLFETHKSLQEFQKNTGFAIYSNITAPITQGISGVVEKYFDMIEADTPELMEKAYQIRRHAYGLKAAFQAPDNLSGTLPVDEYDRRSKYALIQHRQTGAYAATTRLILPDHENPARLFPIEQYCQIDRQDMVKSVPRAQLAEVSRFCVAEDFKRRPGEQKTVSGVSESSAQNPAFDDSGRRRFPHITLVLIGCLLRTATHHGITHWFAVMEPGLMSLLKHMGVHFTPIGPPTHYHGPCVPCLIDVQSLLDGLKEQTRAAAAF